MEQIFLIRPQKKPALYYPAYLINIPIISVKSIADCLDMQGARASAPMVMA